MTQQQRLLELFAEMGVEFSIKIEARTKEQQLADMLFMSGGKDITHFEKKHFTPIGTTSISTDEGRGYSGFSMIFTFDPSGTLVSYSCCE